MRGVNGVAWASCLPGFFLVWGIAHMVGSFSMIPFSAGMWSPNDPTLVLLLVIPLVVALFGSLGVVHLVRLGCRSLYRRHYLSTWNELFSTNMMQMVVDEDYTRLLHERAGDIWSLRWISPPPPRTIEQQLEFAACYQLALRRMLGGVGRLDNTPLWQGGIAYYAGLRGGVVCGCLLYLVLSWLAIALWIIGGFYYIQRCAALAAYCDFLLYDADAR